MSWSLVSMFSFLMACWFDKFSQHLYSFSWTLRMAVQERTEDPPCSHWPIFTLRLWWTPHWCCVHTSLSVLSRPNFHLWLSSVCDALKSCSNICVKDTQWMAALVFACGHVQIQELALFISKWPTFLTYVYSALYNTDCLFSAVVQLKSMLIQL